MKINSKELDRLKSTNRNIMESSFNRIYFEYSHLVFYIALKMLHNEEEAKDITNNTFLQFFINKDKIHSSKKIKYYLSATAKNLSLNRVNQVNKIESLDEEQYLNVEFKKDDKFSSLIDEYSSFLNEEELDIIIYHFLYDFKFKIIAKEKGVSINVITSKYHRALKKIRAYYKENKLI